MNQPMRGVFTGIIVGIVVLIYFVYNFYFSVNFPFQDDFLLIQFIETVSKGGLDPTGLAKELFRTFNDHKAVVPRLVSLVEYQVTGHLNFRFYILLVSLNVTYIFFFIYLQFRKTKIPFYYFLPAPFLFFQPLFHDISGWALNGMQHTYLTAFTVTAIIFVSRGTVLSFFAAMLCCFLATFTHGNGILSYPAIIFYFLCYKDFKRAGQTTIFMFMSLAIYLLTYEAGQAGSLPNDPAVFFSFLFGFIGSEMSLWGNPILWSVIWGGIITGFMICIFVKVCRVYFKRSVSVTPGTIELLTLFAFIFITSTVVATFRSWSGSTIASRFQIYTALSTVIFYVLLLAYVDLFRKRTIYLIVTALSVFYCAYSYYLFTGTVAIKRTTYLADVYNWKTNRNMFSVERSIIGHGAFYLLPAYEKGFFQLPRPIIEKSQLDSMYLSAGDGSLSSGMFLQNWTVRRLSRDGGDNQIYYFVRSDILPEAKLFFTDRFLVIRDKHNGMVHLMQANPKIEARKQIMTRLQYYKPGFSALIRLDDLRTGDYDLGILDVSSSGRKAFWRLDKTLHVDSTALSLK